jgi:mycothione reductase
VKEYGMIVIGSGSAVSVLDAWLRANPGQRGAVVEKDTPGGICLTRGCIPSKLLVASADVARSVQRAGEFGVDVRGVSVDFGRMMGRMHGQIDPEIQGIRQGLSHAPELDFYPVPAEFIGVATLRVGPETIHSDRILLGLGSEPLVPAIPGLAEAGFRTSDSIFALTKLPPRLAILGGGYIAAELAHVFSAAGSAVTVVGRNPRFLPLEEPEVSEVVRGALGQRVRILTAHTVSSVELGRRGVKRLHLTTSTGPVPGPLEVDEIVVATGRGPTSRILHPERSGVKVNAAGWIEVNEYLETSQPGIWALGDATGRHLFKHKANYDAKVLYQNLVRGDRTAVDYHAVPHAVFTEPEVASVGLTEAQAVAVHGSDRVLVGVCPYRETAKGEALGETAGFAKVIVHTDGLKILGAHIVGPQASVLLQEVVTLLYTPERSLRPILDGMHIHPALSEVVERAALRLAPVGGAHHHDHAG